MSQQVNQEAQQANTCLRVAGASDYSEHGKRPHEKTVELLCFKKAKVLPSEKRFTPYFVPNVGLLLSQSLESNFLETVTTLLTFPGTHPAISREVFAKILTPQNNN